MSNALPVTKEFVEIRNGMKLEFLKNFRGSKFITIILISALLSLLFYLIPLLTGTEFPESNISYLSNVLAFTDMAFVLFAIFLGADAINREHSDQTDLLIYPLPQRRSNVITAKYLAQLITAWIGIVIYYGIIALTLVITYGSNAIPNEFVTSLLFSMLYMSAVLAFSFLLSSLFKGTAASMALTFFGIMMLIPILNMLLGLADIDISWVFTNYSSLVSETLGISSGGFGPGGGALETSDADFQEGIFQVTLQAILMFFASVFFGNRREVGA